MVCDVYVSGSSPNTRGKWRVSGMWLVCEWYEWYVSGGGLYNTMIMDGLRAYFPNFPQRKFDELGIPPDAKEAALIAFLADGMIVGKKFLVNNREVSLGKLSLSD